jgi:hypothetical protein
MFILQCDACISGKPPPYHETPIYVPFGKCLGHGVLRSTECVVCTHMHSALPIKKLEIPLAKCSRNIKEARPLRAPNYNFHFARYIQKEKEKRKKENQRVTAYYEAKPSTLARALRPFVVFTESHQGNRTSYR